MLSYPIRISKKTGVAVATCPDFPEVSIECSDRQDALARASGVLEAAIAVRMAQRRELPEPSAGRHRAVLPTPTAMKVRLYQAARARGVTKRELGRRLKWHGLEIARLFDVRHASRLDQLEAAFRALGLRLSVDVEAVPKRRRPAERKASRSPSR